MHTYSPEPGNADKKWHVINATDVILGRLAAQTAALLRRKYKPTFAPHIDMGDYIIIINASKVAPTGKEFDQKIVYCHSGRPDGSAATVYRDLLVATPERAVEKVVKGIPPRNPPDHAQLRKLHVYVGPEYPHAGQSPVLYELTQMTQ